MTPHQIDYTHRHFNPSKDPRVDEIKHRAESLAMYIEKLCPLGPLRDKALIDVQSASMFAVKALFT